MKKIITILMIIAMLTPTTIWATPPVFSGGVNNEYQYEEIVFLTGEPIKFVGTIDVSEKEKETEKTTSYKFKLTSEDKSLDAKLDRTITLVTEYTKRDDKGQTIGQTAIDKYKETLKIGKDKYELEDYQLSKSEITDNRPASDFYSGNLKGRKYYQVNKDEGEIIIDISGSDAGYKNFWGTTDTRTLHYDITSKKEKSSWHGTVEIQTSDSQTKSLRYSNNEANLSSFNGGHIRVTESGMVSRYDYNLPDKDDDELNDRKRNKGRMELKQTMVPKLERLILPKFKDVEGHWAGNAIKKLYSLDVFDEQSQFFTPNIPITRIEFTKAVIKACNIRTSLEEPKKRRGKKEPEEVSLFKDVNAKDDSYKYIKDAVNKKIISGTSDDVFEPTEPLTRAQAITILIRALGFESKAPTSGYYMNFSDDNKIPNWARDSIYVAKEIGLIQGNSQNTVNPNKILTRAEASSMLVSFLEFLEKDLQKDYRENIINF
ncbi:S-layer homology domain-containing protein [Lutibacter sp. B2]|nr:S-layer homology domain-containing protein [Lutibacter sp. B2]